MLSFQRKRLWLKYYDNLQLLLKNFIMHSLSTPHEHELPELKWIMLMWYMIPWNATKELWNVMLGSLVFECYVNVAEWSPIIARMEILKIEIVQLEPPLLGVCWKTRLHSWEHHWVNVGHIHLQRTIYRLGPT